MNDDAFWQFVSECGGSPTVGADSFVANWRAKVERLSPDELVGVNIALARALRLACNWDIRGVAYIMNGGCTDDDFLYFRQWLVSRGRAFFEAALRNPDEIANSMPAGIHAPNEIHEIKDLDLCLGDMWEQKTGKDQFDSENGFPDEEVDLDEPAGEKWQEDATTMSRRFPKCWARFVELSLPG